MTDNTEKIKKFLRWDSKDDFYFVQVIKRRKENPTLKWNSMIVKRYYIKSVEELDYHLPEMKMLSWFHNGRVYINLNRRSFEKTAILSLRKTMENVFLKNYESVRRAFSSSAEKHTSGDKFWVVDIDNGEDITEVASFIFSLRPVGEKVIDVFSTKTGNHIISRPFDLAEFRKRYTLDVNKNSPTLMFCP